MEKRMFQIGLIILLFGVGLVGTVTGECECPVALPDELDPSAELLAGQTIPVGYVYVWNNETCLYVWYEITEEGWYLTETHLAVNCNEADIPQKNGNPIPGQFAYGEDFGVTGATSWCQEVEKPDCDNLDCGDDIAIAAHAAVQFIDCETVIEAPYGAFEVNSSAQRKRKDGSSVREERSDPGAVLTWDINKIETDFFSLGFEGEIVVEFDCCIANEEGPDVLVVEDTWGTYPNEKADVYASDDGVTWIYLGEANNTVRDTTNNWQTVSRFDLGDIDCARFIKVIDTTDQASHSSDADGFDLNTIQALHNCVDCTIYYETAWSNGTDFPGKNWGMYLEYAWMCPICDCDEAVDVQFTSPFENVDSTYGWSVDNSVAELGTSLSILGGDATVYGYRGAIHSNISQRGYRGLGIWGGIDNDEIDANNTEDTTDDESIEVVFTEPYCVSRVEIRSLFTGGDENVNIPPEKAQVELYQDTTVIDFITIVGTEPLEGTTYNGTAYDSFEAVESIDKVVFRMPELPPEVLDNEFAIAGFTVCPWQFEWE